MGSDDFFYKALVSDTYFWQEVGRELESIRLRREWRTPHAMWKAAKKHGLKPPHYSVFKKHEDGKFNTFKKLAVHARLLDVEMVDVIRRVLEARKGGNPPSAEGAQVLKKFERLRQHPRRQLQISEFVNSMMTATVVEAAALTPAALPAPKRKGRRKP